MSKSGVDDKPVQSFISGKKTRTGEIMKKKTKIINIYLSKDDYRTLNDIKNKYHLSYSTIVDIIVKETGSYINDLMGGKDKYLYRNEECKKTSIKPRNENKCNIVEVNNLTIGFLRKDFENKLNKNQFTEKVYNRIYSKFQTTYDENWDGNKFSRSMVRWLKKNREYAKKVLDDE